MKLTSNERAGRLGLLGWPVKLTLPLLRLSGGSQQLDPLEVQLGHLLVRRSHERDQEVQHDDEDNAPEIWSAFRRDISFENIEKLKRNAFDGKRISIFAFLD